MESLSKLLKPFVPLSIVGGAILGAVFSFNTLLNSKIDPVKENQAEIKAQIAPLKENQSRMEKRMDSIERKLDQLILQKITRK